MKFTQIFPNFPSFLSFPVSLVSCFPLQDCGPYLYFVIVGNSPVVRTRHCRASQVFRQTEKGFLSKQVFYRKLFSRAQSCLLAVTATQAVYDEFLALGGFSLFAPLLVAAREDRQLLLALLSTLLNSSCLLLGKDTVLLYPQLVAVCLRFVAQLEAPSDSRTELWSLLLDFLNRLLADRNPAAELNLNMVTGWDLLDSLLAGLQTIGRGGEETLAPLSASIGQLLSALPAGPVNMRKMLSLTIGCLPPHLLYLPHLSAPLLLAAATYSGGPADVGTPLVSQNYIDKIHSTDVIGRLR